MAPPVDDYLKGGINKYLLWGKKPDDEDFLFVRLGTGSRIFNINIAIPKDKFSVVNDELKQLPKRLKYKYRMLKSSCNQFCAGWNNTAYDVFFKSNRTN